MTNACVIYSLQLETPDAKIWLNGETGIVEIKCPYKYRDATLAEAAGDESFFSERHALENQVNVKTDTARYAETLC